MGPKVHNACMKAARSVPSLEVQTPALPPRPPQAPRARLTLRAPQIVLGERVRQAEVLEAGTPLDVTAESGRVFPRVDMVVHAFGAAPPRLMSTLYGREGRDVSTLYGREGRDVSTLYGREGGPRGGGPAPRPRPAAFRPRIAHLHAPGLAGRRHPEHRLCRRQAARAQWLSQGQRRSPPAPAAAARLGPPCLPRACRGGLQTIAQRACSPPTV
jgi:hypothetical protein